ncbi:PGPGW domain-containing protein [Candidatus Thiothrix sp. Deng01]|uniref:PGPGW domain-containing protein n=1 Tax=Candidatus Thiothrix phosphatis TaxID=3112415 RepID=A0ABU6CW30_9GAMM|nr:PGPGW domain-containing protein [Candidatus Thiothrix sp. Deng01]MEB4590984.1 PGPGW domain-containing protein [Candidatus Thiothrix sp. Deng01]
MEQAFIWLGAVSAITFLFSLLMLPWFVGRIPADYFTRPRDPHRWHILLQPRAILRNLLGLPIILAGIAMLVLPGQGILTIMVGLGVMSFPGKFELEKWVITRRGVLKALNWIRSKGGRPPIAAPDAGTG